MPTGVRLRPVTDDDMFLLRVAETAVELAEALLRRGDAVAARSVLDGASHAVAALPQATTLRAAVDDAWRQVDDLAERALAHSDPLTLAELRVLRFLPSYMTLGQIAARLHVSTNTVKTHVHAIYRKLDVSSRSAAVERAAALGLVDAWTVRTNVVPSAIAAAVA